MLVWKTVEFQCLSFSRMMFDYIWLVASCRSCDCSKSILHLCWVDEPLRPKQLPRDP